MSFHKIGSEGLKGEGGKGGGAHAINTDSKTVQTEAVCGRPGSYCKVPAGG